jgi:hypothetical protein
MNLIEHLSQIEDPRRSEGQRHPLVPFLLMLIMGIMSGRYGYREQAKFMKSHRATFSDLFMLKHGTPSHVTIRTLLNSLPYASLNAVFEAWAIEFVGVLPKDWLSADGKALRSTVEHGQDSWQNFVSLVSLFHQRTGSVLATERLENGKESEIPALQVLLQRLGITRAMLTIDALHCQKKLQPLSLPQAMTT